MESIKIVKIVSKTTKTQKPYKMCEVEVNGEIRKVNIWSNAPNFANLVEGSVIMGKMAMDGQYWNISFEGQEKPQGEARGAYKQQVIEKTMEKKEASIGKFQDNKEHSIKIASTMRMGVDIATSLTPEQWHGTTMQEEIRFWREWCWNEWDNLNFNSPFNE
ncbi:hypothetical protein M0R04_13725 [Candidatus Dojkabacteria bacterium]|jgi:hypothetical protein|nr:hypothetical protein [Candidatus Dojkabacteria bacterium]